MGLSYTRFAGPTEVAAALAADAGLRCLGGGTLLVRGANMGDTSIGGYAHWPPAAAEIALRNGEAVLDARLTMSRLAAHPELAWLAHAVRCVGGPAVRNMATVGGNLHAPSPYGDFAVALLALGARVELHLQDRSETVTLEAFFAQRTSTWRHSVIGAVRFALPARTADFRFRKVSRVKPKGAAVLTIAALIGEQDGVVSSARIAYGAMAPHPLRAEAAEAALLGQPLDQRGITAALRCAADGTQPRDDAIASAWYRREVLPVHLRRLLLAQH